MVAQINFGSLIIAGILSMQLFMPADTTPLEK
jgi:hypothetical protein